MIDVLPDEIDLWDQAEFAYAREQERKAEIAHALALLAFADHFRAERLVRFEAARDALAAALEEAIAARESLIEAVELAEDCALLVGRAKGSAP